MKAWNLKIKSFRGNKMDYRGEVSAIFYTTNDSNFYQIGERCCQVVVLEIPRIKFIEKDELSETIRGTGGYGHTGR